MMGYVETVLIILVYKVSVLCYRFISKNDKWRAQKSYLF